MREARNDGPERGASEWVEPLLRPEPPTSGRTYRVNRTPVTATVQCSDLPWGDASPPSTSGMPYEVRDRLAQEWMRDGLYEHASIAAFSRFAMELMAVGAPSDLIVRAHEAALDEVRHTQLSFALASAYRGQKLRPSAFPFEPQLVLERTLVGLAQSTFEEGCIGETLAAIQANEQLELATDPAVCSTLAEIVQDEARHALFAWHSVAWMLREGGDAVSGALATVLGGASWVPDASDAAPRETREIMLAHGRLDPHRLHVLQVRGLKEVIIPCAKAMLADPSAEPEFDRASIMLARRAIA